MYKVIIGLTVVGLVAGLYLYLLNIEMDSKREWSVLQSGQPAGIVKKVSGRITIVNHDGFGERIGVVTADHGRMVWILANPKSGEQIKLLPLPTLDGRNKVRITGDEFNFIAGEVILGQELRMFLLNSID